MKKMTKTGLITAVAVTIAAASLAPQTAWAHKKKKAKRAARPAAAATAAATIQGSTERRLRQMEDELQVLRQELARSRSEAKAEVRATAAKVEQEQQQVEQKLAKAEEHEKTHHDLLFFRGGFAKMEHARNNELLLNNDVLRAAGLTSTTDAKDGEGWYVGAGFDHRLTDDLWGITDIAALDGEVMFEYKNFGSSHNALVDAGVNNAILPVGTGGAIPPGGNLVTIKNQLTQFTLTASPKIKFNNLGDFRPWIIPFGLAIHVISPPSSGVTVLNPGLMVGTGAEYKIWKDLYAGLDFRYHFTGGDLNYKTKLPNGTTVLNRTDIDGFTTGAYLGFGF